MSIHDLLKGRAAESPSSAALAGLARAPLTYSDLLVQIERTVQALRLRGITRGDRVALVLPNGPESAVACFAIASAAACAPLNPAYSTAEFEFYFRDLKPKALVIPPDFAPPAVAAARKLGVRVIHLHSDPTRPAGSFDLEGQLSAEPPPMEFARAADTALLLHTSGSTSRAKMVPLTHANLCESSRNIASSLSLKPTDCCLNIMPLFHIHGLIGAVLSSWTAGASVAAMPDLQAPEFFEWIREFQPTWYTAVPAMHRSILMRARQLSCARGTSLRFARSCSSALAPKLMAEVEDALGIPLVEAYGMTEASHQMTINPLPPAARKPGSVGLAAGCSVAIMDGSGNLLGPGEVGDVVIRGANVTAGYEGNPDANRACFIAGWFRTGDQGRIDHDGYLFLTGRSKEIINRGGEKIAPREVDEVLADHPAIQEVVTFATPDSRLGEDVAAAVVLKTNHSLAPAELREFASRRLADFKIPGMILFVPELPKGPTGKILRIGLAQKLGLTPAEDPSAKQQTQTFAAPVTDAERLVADIWRELLGIPFLGLHDDFFDLGGDSILATRVLVRLRKEASVAIPMFQLFGSPRLIDFARVVELAPRVARDQNSPIRAVPRTGLLPLSPAQLRMWFLSRFEESSSAYCIPMAVRLRGPLQVEALRRSLEHIVARHEILRTQFIAIDGTPFQRILEPPAIELPVEDVSALEGERLSWGERSAYQEAHRRWDLAADLPIRARLIRFDPEDHLLLLVIHHIAADGWSKSVLFRELEGCYSAERRGVQPDLPPLPIQYADFAQWRIAFLDSPASERLASYWAKRFAGLPALLELPLDRPRPPRQSFEGSIVRARVPASLRDALARVSRQESATLHMILLAGLAALLSRCAGQQEFCIGVPAAFRIRRELEPLIGAFVNTLPIRVAVPRNIRFKELLADIRRDSLDAHAHEEFPLERILEVAQPPRSLSYSPLFQVLFQLRNFPEIATRLEGLQAEMVRFDSGTSQFDLSLDVTETPAGLDLALIYSSALFDRETAERLLAQYQGLIAAVARDIEIPVADLPLLSESERAQLLDGWNQTVAQYPRESAITLFERQVELRPSYPAVSGSDRSLSYQELDRWASAIGGELAALGVKRGSVVAICIERSSAMLAGLLGIWKAGAAYVPLDPSYPRQRLRFVLEDSGASVLLCDRVPELLLESVNIAILRIPDADSPTAHAIAPENAPGPEDLAYLLYTSGSTGKPKGVPIRQKSLVNTLCSMGKTLEFAPAERVLALTTISFDISCVELFLPLIVGAEVIVADRGLSGDGGRLSREIERTQATFVQATPATWQILIDSGWTARPGLKILSGGEPLPKPLAVSLCRASLWNGYGPTETAIYSTVARIRADDERITIGRPLDNTQVYVLDGNLQPVPVGVTGELYLGGDGLSPGYWRRPDLAAERFVANPFSTDPASRLYRTGDLVRYRPCGRIEFLRRADNQVKLRGFRIELEEVESAAQTHPGVRSAAAAILQPQTSEARLALFYSPVASQQPDATPFADDLRRHLKESLPGYMVPFLFVPLGELPRTPSGKIDRKALADSADAGALVSSNSARPVETAAGSTPERTMSEELLLEIWEDVLGQPVAPDDDFFVLGGHSLLAARLVARVESAFGSLLPLSAFFEAPTVAQMLSLLGPGARAAHSKVIPIRSGAGTPLYVLHPSPMFRSLYLALPPRARILAVSVPAPAAGGADPRLEQTAERQLKAIREYQPDGQVVLLGWCADGILAIEMAQQLRRAGNAPPLIVLVDAYAPRFWRRATGKETLWHRISHYVGRAIYFSKNRRTSDSAEWMKRLKSHWDAARDMGEMGSSNPTLVRAAWAYEPSPYPGPVVMFRAMERPWGKSADPASFWGESLPDLEVVDVPGNHVEMLKEPHVQIIANYVSRRLGWDLDSAPELARLSAALGGDALDVGDLAAPRSPQRGPKA